MTSLPASPSAPEPTPEGDDSCEGLWEDIRAQKEGAYEHLRAVIWKYCPPVFSHSMVPSSERGDLLEDVLFSVWEFAGKQNDAPKNFPSFLKWRARAVLSTFRRKLEAQRRLEPIEVVLTLPSGEASQVDVAVMQEISETYSLCRGQLEPKYALVWRLRFEQDLDPEATGRELKITPQSVATRLFRAREKLMECLVSKGIFS